MGAPPPSSASPMWLLLVDHREGRATIAAGQLETDDEPYRVVRVATVAQAIDRLRARAFDCAVLADDLPDGGALELLQSTGVAGRVPVLLLTPEGGLANSAIEAMQYGVADVVHLSELPTRALSRAIRAAVERHRFLELRLRLHHADRFRAVGQLAAGVAHGVNNPAAALTTYLGMLLDNIGQVRDRIGDQGADPTVRKLVDEIEDFARCGLDASARISEMASYLETLSRAQRETPEELSIADVARMASKLSGSSLAAGTSLVEDIDETAPLVGHRARLCGAVAALLANASESFAELHTADQVITLRTRDRDDAIVIEVEDNGCGMTEDVAARAVEAFYTTARDRGRLGLGLAMCADVVATHAGTLDIDSHPQRGTRVTLTLPRDNGLRTTTSAPAPSAPARGNATDGRLRVLVVDDDPLVRPALARLLGRRHDVTEADSGLAALSILESDHAFDVILSDLVMPDIDGPGLYEQVAGRWPELRRRFVFLTGAAFGERAMAFVERTDAPVLQKPVSRDALFAAVERAGGRS